MVKQQCTPQQLLFASPTTSPNQSLLTVMKGGKQVVMTVDMLTKALKVMLDELGV